jgi:hypothetical protein
MWNKLPRRFLDLIGVLFVILFFTFIYAYYQSQLFHGEIHRTGLAYYNYLIDSMIHGKTDISPESKYDLSVFHDKYYMYWGPSPALFVLPFYLVSSLEANDMIYGLVAGIANCVIFFFVVNEFIKFFKIKLTWYAKFICIACFAFASPNFYLSMAGNIWFVNQIIAVFYLLLFYLFYFKFLNTKKLLMVIIAVIFFSLAWTSRYTLIFNGLFLIYPIYLLFKERLKKKLILYLIFIPGLVLISIVCMAFYNNARFQNPLETGYRYQVGSDRFNKAFREGDIFSFSHIPHNITYYFLNHISISFEKPFVLIDSEGNSVFSVYPLLLTLFLLIRIYKIKEVHPFILLACLSIGLSILVLMMNLGTGWVQFGSRYFFDVIPILFLFTLFAVRKIYPLVLTIILIYGVVINFLGTWAMYG